MIIMTIFMYTSYTLFSFSYTHPFYTYRYKPRTLSLSLPVISSNQFYFIVQLQRIVINAYIIYNQNTSDDKKLSRMEFTQLIIEDLAHDHLLNKR
jgi:hypothetical protein